MVIIESILASAVSGFILKQVADAHIRKHCADDVKSKSTEESYESEADESLGDETPTQEDQSSQHSDFQIARAVLIQDSSGHVRHAIVFDGPVELDSLSAVDLLGGPTELMTVMS